MIYQVPLVFVIVAALLATGYWLVPDTSETALIYYKSERYAAARDLYQLSIQQGDAGVETYRGLAQLHIHFGDVDKAIAVTEDYLEKRPDDTSALRRLATYYQYAQRQQDFRRALERLKDIDPNPRILRDLANIYNELGRYGDQADVLRELIDRQQAEPRDYLRLARLLAGQGNLGQAAGVLSEIEVASAENFNFEAVLLKASLLAGLGRHDDALTIASRAMGTVQAGRDDLEPLGAAQELADALAFRANPAVAVRFLAALADHPNPDRITALRAEYEAAAGETATALARFKELYAADALPRESMDTAGDVALQAEDYGFLFTLVRQAPLSLGRSTLVRAIEIALDQGRAGLAQAVATATGGQLLNESPVLGARVALARGDRAAALRWAQRAVEGDVAEVGRRFALIDILRELAREQLAVEYLTATLRADSLAPLPDWALRQGANLYIAMDAPGTGLSVYVDKRRQRRDSFAANFGWALTAAASGYGQPVLAWYRRQDAGALSPDQLGDLFYAARRGDAHALAAAVGQRRYAQAPTPQNRYELGLALTDSGQYRQARAELGALLENGNAPDRWAAEDAYLTALRAMYDDGASYVADDIRRAVERQLTERAFDASRWATMADMLLTVGAKDRALPVMARLIRAGEDGWVDTYVATAQDLDRSDAAIDMIESRLTSLDLSPERQESLVFTLMDMAPEARALPHVRDLAVQMGDPWRGIYANMLENVRGPDALADYLVRRAARPQADAAEKRRIAQRLPDLGRKAEAISLLKAIAADAPPDSEDVAYLLYLWGPRPPQSGMDWLAQRLADADSTDAKAGWGEHLLARGGAERVIAALEGADERPGRFGPITELRLAAYRAAGDRTGLERLIARAVMTAETAQNRRRAAELAYAEGLTELADTGYERLLAADPDAVQALKRRGQLAYFDGDRATARKLLGRYLDFAAAEDDWQSRYYLGQMAEERGEAGRARRLYREAQAIIEEPGAGDPDRAVAYARMSYALDKPAEGQAIFERLLARGGDAREAALMPYIRILLDRGDTERAGALLDPAGV